MVTWTGIARREHSREGLRYPSDMTDAEWALAAPFVPAARRGGRPRTSGYARGPERDALCCRKRMRLAAFAQMLSSRIDSAALLLRLAHRWFVRSEQHGTGHELA